MPYKDEEQAREAARLRKQKQRLSRPDVPPDNVTPSLSPDVTPLLHRPNGVDYNPEELIYGNPYYEDGTKRYLGPLSDGQVLDRLTVQF